MRETLVILLLIYASVNSSQNIIPEFMHTIPYYDVKGKVRTLEVRHYNTFKNGKIVTVDEDGDDYNVYNKYFFSRVGTVDSLIYIFNGITEEKNLGKTYFEKDLPIMEWQGVIMGNDTVFKTRKELMYKLTDDKNILNYTKSIDIETGEITTEIDTTIVDYENQSIRINLSSYSSTQFYENMRLVKRVNDSRNEHMYTQKYIYEGDLLVKEYMETKDYSGEKIYEYSSIDNDGNWLSRTVTELGVITTVTEREIDYWN